MALFNQHVGKVAVNDVANSMSGERIGTSTTFAVSPVTPATAPLPVVPYHEAVTDFLGGKVESCSLYHGELVANVRSHPLIHAIHLAFADHRPLCLSPDIIWLTLTHGLALHINANAERLRHHFVKHAGKAKIAVRRDDFVKGSPENPWPEVFHKFSAVIQDHIGDAHRLIVADFSTTGPVERAASEIVLMDAMQAYFSYVFQTICGIPSITLEGTLDDWRAIAERTRKFRQFGLDWWVDALEPILNQFVAAASGKIDQSFWDSIYQWHGEKGCGRGPFVTGWIVNLFPYLNPITDDLPFLNAINGAQSDSVATFRRNPWVEIKPSTVNGPKIDHFPHLPAKAPFVWEFMTTKYQMEFIGGLIGIKQDPQTLSLRPEIGWAVWEAGAVKRKRQADAETAERKEREKAEIAAKELAARNYEPNRRFDDARKLGLQLHQLYLAAKPTGPSDSHLDDEEPNRLLLDIATRNYHSNFEFQQLWDTVHKQPPTPLHLKWLSLWKRLS